MSTVQPFPERKGVNSEKDSEPNENGVTLSAI